MKRYIFVAILAVLLLARGNVQASLFTVDALSHSAIIGEVANTTACAGLNTGIYVSAGQTLTVTADPTDFWSAGALPRWSNADGLIGNRIAAAGDESGEAAGTLIGTNFGLWTHSGLSAPYGALVGELGGTLFLLGTNFSGLAPASGTLTLFYWDENNYDNTGNINVNIAAVPEPGSFLLTGIGLIGLAAFARRTVGLSAKEHQRFIRCSPPKA